MGREYELKYRADAPILEEIAAQYGPFSTLRMESAYYDTPASDLSRRYWTLRRRLENGRPLCALKTPLPDGSRGEWEVEQEDIGAAIPMLCKLGAPQELLSLTRAGLQQRCAARFTRRAALLTLQSCTVELALDRGELTGGGKCLPLSEVEVELKSGSEAAAAAFAGELARRFGLVPEPESKFSRAAKLAEGE